MSCKTPLSRIEIECLGYLPAFATSLVSRPFPSLPGWYEIYLSKQGRDTPSCLDLRFPLAETFAPNQETFADANLLTLREAR